MNSWWGNLWSNSNTSEELFLVMMFRLKEEAIKEEEAVNKKVEKKRRQRGQHSGKVNMINQKMKITRKQVQRITIKNIIKYNLLHFYLKLRRFVGWAASA